MTSQQWGRVDDDGTVYVRTADGERSVGQYPEGTPEEALAFFTERYDALAFEVELLEQRIKSGVMSPEEARRVGARPCAAQVADAHAVGDLDALAARLDALAPVIDAAARGPQGRAGAEAPPSRKAAKERIVAEAEKLAEGTDWRNGANRLRDLLDEWKALPRLDRASDDALWRRFSTARTTYTRRRKAHFAEQHEKRDAARVVKERLAKEAEALAGSTDWGPTAGRYRDLMRRVEGRRARAARRRRRAVEALPRRPGHVLRRPRRGQRRSRTRSSPPTPRSRRQLLVEAEALLPVTDLDGRQAGLPRHRRALGRRRQGPARPDEGRSRAGSARSSRPSAASRTSSGAAPTRRSPPAPTTWSAKLEAAIAEVEADLEQGPGRRQREEGQGARGEPRLPPGVPRDGPEGLRRLLRLTASGRMCLRPGRVAHCQVPAASARLGGCWPSCADSATG